MAQPAEFALVLPASFAAGLKPESRKALVEQFVDDHIEKTPTEN